MSYYFAVSTPDVSCWIHCMKGGSVAAVRRSRLELGFSYRVFLLDPLSSAFRATVTLIKPYRE